MMNNNVLPIAGKPLKIMLFGIFFSALWILLLSCTDPTDESRENAPVTRVSSISFSLGNYLPLNVGQERTIQTVIEPDNAANRNLTWISSNENAVTVENGLVKAIAAGTSIITAAAQDGSGVLGNITVTVRAAQGTPSPEEPGIEDEEAPGDPNYGAIPLTPQEIFDYFRGKRAVTYGWADRFNNGAGLYYANPANLTLIDGTSTPAKRQAFTNAIASDAPTFIILSGDVDLSDGRINDHDHSFFDQFDPVTHRRINGDIVFNMGSNTTLIGINNARIMYGGIRINNKENIIIKNITFWDAHGSTEHNTAIPEHSDSKASIDALVVQGTSNGVWVTHNKFTNGLCDDMIRNLNHDGAFDIPRGINITVSWNEFTNYDKVMLIAGSDSVENAVYTDRQITLHHNYFHRVTQRMPRTRGTQMHIYNNYYDNIGVPGNNGYAMGPGQNARFIVQNNFFGSMRNMNRVVDYYDSAQFPAVVYQSGNNRTFPRSQHDNTGGIGKPWEPQYLYTLTPASELPALIPAKAGPTLVFKR